MLLKLLISAVILSAAVLYLQRQLQTGFPEKEKKLNIKMNANPTLEDHRQR